VAKKQIPPCVQVTPWVKDGVYVGIDQSMTGTGVCVFDSQHQLIGEKLIETKAGSHPMDEVQRIITLFSETHKFVMSLALGRKVCAVMEDFAFSQAHQMAKLGGLGWHFRIMMSRTDWHFGCCGTNVLKKFATGKGTCEKDQVMLGVYKRWTYESSDNNVADAYVLGRISLAAYAKPTPGTLGVRKDDLELASKITIYR
jgi:Holliday junction resolvasome RuvABC endonuclease subunit